MTTVLVIRSPGKAGKYHIPLRVVLVTDSATHSIGEQFQVSFEI